MDSNPNPEIEKDDAEEKMEPDTDLIMGGSRMRDRTWDARWN